MNNPRAIEDMIGDPPINEALLNDSPAEPKVNASDCLKKAAGHLSDRASTYDSLNGERSMARTISTFYALTDVFVTEEQGWMFMALLKMVRSQQGDFKLDNYEDGAAYFALAAEAASEERSCSQYSRPSDEETQDLSAARRFSKGIRLE